MEGKFFVWTRAEVDEILGQTEADLFADIYDITAAGNWEGHNILHLTRTLGPRSEAAADLAEDELRPPAGREQEETVRGAQQAHLAGTRREDSDRLERPDDRGLRPSGASAWESPNTARRPYAPPTFC